MKWNGQKSSTQIIIIIIIISLINNHYHRPSAKRIKKKKNRKNFRVFCQMFSFSSNDIDKCFPLIKTSHFYLFAWLNTHDQWWLLPFHFQLPCVVHFLLFLVFVSGFFFFLTSLFDCLRIAHHGYFNCAPCVRANRAKWFSSIFLLLTGPIIILKHSTQNNNNKKMKKNWFRENQI